jgi:hypothetical protein
MKKISHINSNSNVNKAKHTCLGRGIPFGAVNNLSKNDCVFAFFSSSSKNRTIQSSPGDAK